jgi:hypothetical protein
MAGNKTEDEVPSGEYHDNSYTTRGDDAKVAPVVPDDEPVEDPYARTNPNSNAQLGKPTKPPILKSHFGDLRIEED